MIRQVLEHNKNKHLDFGKTNPIYDVGVEFIDANGGGAGVRVRENKLGK